MPSGCALWQDQAPTWSGTLMSGHVIPFVPSARLSAFAIDGEMPDAPMVLPESLCCSFHLVVVPRGGWPDEPVAPRLS